MSEINQWTPKECIYTHIATHPVLLGHELAELSQSWDSSWDSSLHRVNSYKVIDHSCSSQLSTFYRECVGTIFAFWPQSFWPTMIYLCSHWCPSPISPQLCGPLPRLHSHFWLVLTHWITVVMCYCRPFASNHIYHDMVIKYEQYHYNHLCMMYTLVWVTTYDYPFKNYILCPPVATVICRKVVITIFTMVTHYRSQFFGSIKK